MLFENRLSLTFLSLEKDVQPINWKISYIILKYKTGGKVNVASQKLLNITLVISQIIKSVVKLYL